MKSKALLFNSNDNCYVEYYSVVATGFIVDGKVDEIH